MKITILTKGIFVVSLLLFTACSNSQSKISKNEIVGGIIVKPVMIPLPKHKHKPLPLTSISPMLIKPSFLTKGEIFEYDERFEYVKNFKLVASKTKVKKVKHKVKKKYTKRKRKVGVEDIIEKRAKKLLGRRYVWGATGPRTYDCSGFTRKIYREVGIRLPRVSYEQAKVGKYIRYKNLRKGDMVFFDTHKRKTGKVTHVGIYLGNDNFIHASSSAKKVVICNFKKKKFYKRRFLWGRRVVKDKLHYASR